MCVHCICLPMGPNMHPWVCVLISRSVLSQVDLVLDTLVKNGHTTSLDALWGAVPVVTLPMERMETRASTSAYESMEWSPLVVHSLKEYEDMAVRLAWDKQLLQEVKGEVSEGSAGQRSPVLCSF